MGRASTFHAASDIQSKITKTDENKTKYWKQKTTNPLYLVNSRRKRQGRILT